MSSTPVRLADIVPFSWVDGPGNRFVVFAQGCPFDCLACHNPETIPPLGPDTRHTTVTALLKEIRLAEPYLAGVTVSGGEATGQWRFVRDLFTAIRSDPQLSRLTTYVDTNGHALRRVWDALLPVTDGFMVDLKALDPMVHHRLTGRGNALVLDSIRYLHERGRLHEVRLLLVPGFNDSPDQLARTAAWLTGIDPGVRVVVIGFRRHGVRAPWADIVEAGPEVVDRARVALEDAGLREVVTV
jgi:pyruvate-formate lyase-activating enzyme